jgi:hypothetical protein
MAAIAAMGATRSGHGEERAASRRPPTDDAAVIVDVITMA